MVDAQPAVLATNLFRQTVEGNSMSDLDKVLAHIDAERDASLDRLFNFLAIKSISTDPAYADECDVAATSLAADLSKLDIDAEVHPTDASASSSTATTTCSRSIRSICGSRRRSSRASPR
jgi:hypothetical protein